MAPRRGNLSERPRTAASVGSTLSFIPADPVDRRLTIAGAVCGADGRVDITAYEDITQVWASEPPPDVHPDPMHPGVRRGEEVGPSLRVWDSCNYPSGKAKDGAGWVAVKLCPRGQRLKRFNIRTCGSWRLAFLLARLQRNLWENEDVAKHNVGHLMGSPLKGISPGKRLLRRRSSQEAASSKLPQKRLLRRASSAEGPGSPTKRLKREASAEDSAEKVAAKRLRRQKSGGGSPQKSRLNIIRERILARVKDGPTEGA